MVLRGGLFNQVKGWPIPTWGKRNWLEGFGLAKVGLGLIKLGI